MNDIIQAMETRRSIRQFKPDMPRKEDLQQIIEAGLYAANGRGRQGAIILAVTNRELRDRLSALNREIGGFPEGKDPFYGAPAVLIVLADKSCPTGIYDGSLVMGNLMLAAHALGLGSIWVHRAKEEFERPEYQAAAQRPRRRGRMGRHRPLRRRLYRRRSPAARTPPGRPGILG